ncbi:MerR family DNA-binding protein [Cobetia sp. UCD-24C]|uniref:MerR family DNA-binding protein n=1 Tax=Cobetia sp. UCD-24C TaxID=1716176 RepID=UPI0006CA2410|nr:MerR family DNA-binding protein [Cobetia sp. UCD-24C]KPM77718.1 MerR family transcriptional regulator [Cobetia sp. UCD-24C]
MKVAELARAGGVTAETVRHYTRQGLITARRDPVNNYQRFDEQALVRLKFISQARQLGFSLADIKQILEQADQHDSPCPLVRDLLRQHLPRVRERIRELESLAERMEHALDCWQDLPDGVPDGNSVCCLIEGFPQDVPDTASTSKRRGGGQS